LPKRIRNKYANENLLPILKAEKRLKGVHFAVLWLGLVSGVTEYMFTSTLLTIGFTWWQSLLIIFSGNCIVWFIIVLIGTIGAKYGISFPVVMRCSFGLEGAKFVAVLRSIIACGWFSILTWQGSRCLFEIFELILPGLQYFRGDVFGCNILLFFCLIIFILLQLYIACGGMRMILRLQYICVPVLFISLVTIFIFFYLKLPDLSKALNAVESTRPSSIKFDIIITALVSTIAVWSTVAVNICDFTRYAKNQKSQLIGQFIGLPIGMAVVSFIGLFITGCSVILFGKLEWNPIILLHSFSADSHMNILGYFVLIICVLATNMAANIVPVANTLSCLAPRILSFRVAAFLACLIGLLFLPLQLIENRQNYVYLWLVGYCNITGAIAGIIISDYYFLRKGVIKIKALYKPGSEYSYLKGWNLIAVAVLIIAMLPSLPGFLKYAGNITVMGNANKLFEGIYNYSWFIAFAIALTLYYILMKMCNNSHIGK
jgi:nucleobase:cation symporter-1, NCS1 family